MHEIPTDKNVTGYNFKMESPTDKNVSEATDKNVSGN
jgi:hypothetical protein